MEEMTKSCQLLLIMMLLVHLFAEKFIYMGALNSHQESYFVTEFKTMTCKREGWPLEIYHLESTPNVAQEMTLNVAM